MVHAEGMVYDVGWSFGDGKTTHWRKFCVLDELSCDVVLSNDFLFETDGFWMMEGASAVEGGFVTENAIAGAWKCGVVYAMQREKIYKKKRQLGKGSAVE